MKRNSLCGVPGACNFCFLPWKRLANGGAGGWVEGEEGGRRRGGNSGTTSDTLPEARQGREGKGEAALSVESRPR